MFSRKYRKYRIGQVAEEMLSLGGAPRVVRKFARTANDEFELRKNEEQILRAIDIRYMMKLFSVPNHNKLVPVAKRDAVQGAIYGDLIGSQFEGRSLSLEEAEKIVCSQKQNMRITDDSVLTVATEAAVLEYERNRKKYRLKNNLSMKAITGYSTVSGSLVDLFQGKYLEWAKKHENAGYGFGFTEWMNSEEHRPYGSWGNGSAMRVGPIGCAGLPHDETLKMAIASAVCTHDSFEGVEGAVVAAMSVWMACCGCTKDEIFLYVKKAYSGPGIKLFEQFTNSEAMSIKTGSTECQFSVPAAVIAVHESESFEEAIRNALCIGLDTDTNASVAGAIAGAVYGFDVRNDMAEYVENAYNMLSGMRVN